MTALELFALIYLGVGCAIACFAVFDLIRHGARFDLTLVIMGAGVVLVWPVVVFAVGIDWRRARRRGGAQWDYDRAVLLRDQAAAVVRDKNQAIVAAREKLEQAKRKSAEAIPVDRSARQLSGGGPVTEDHREIKPESGQQKGYVVLTPAERAKGFVRPFRDAYRHLKCGAITTMSRNIAETYARDPRFYSGTFCATCRAHFPVGENGEFTWYEMDGREGPKVGT